MAPSCYIIGNYRLRRSHWYATQANPMNTYGENDFYPILTKSAIFRLIWQVAPPFEQLCIRVSWATLLCNINEFCPAVSEEKIFEVAHIVKPRNHAASDTRSTARRPFWIAQTWFEQLLMATHWTTFMQNFAATWPAVSEEMSKMWKVGFRPAVSRSM